MATGRKSSILKPPKVREPLQDLNQLLPNKDDDDETTTTITDFARKRRVSFVSIQIKEFQSSHQSEVVLHTPAYEEQMSASSDSYQSNTVHSQIDASILSPNGSQKENDFEVRDYCEQMQQKHREKSPFELSDSNMELTKVSSSQGSSSDLNTFDRFVSQVCSSDFNEDEDDDDNIFMIDDDEDPYVKNDTVFMETAVSKNLQQCAALFNSAIDFDTSDITTARSSNSVEDMEMTEILSVTDVQLEDQTEIGIKSMHIDSSVQNDQSVIMPQSKVDDYEFEVLTLDSVQNNVYAKDENTYGDQNDKKAKLHEQHHTNVIISGLNEILTSSEQMFKQNSDDRNVDIKLVDNSLFLAEDDKSVDVSLSSAQDVKSVDVSLSPAQSSISGNITTTFAEKSDFADALDVSNSTTQPNNAKRLNPDYSGQLDRSVQKLKCMSLSVESEFANDRNVKFIESPKVIYGGGHVISSNRSRDTQSDAFVSMSVNMSTVVEKKSTASLNHRRRTICNSERGKIFLQQTAAMDSVDAQKFRSALTFSDNNISGGSSNRSKRSNDYDAGDELGRGESDKVKCISVSAKSKFTTIDGGDNANIKFVKTPNPTDFSKPIETFHSKRNSIATRNLFENIVDDAIDEVTIRDMKNLATETAFIAQSDTKLTAEDFSFNDNVTNKTISEVSTETSSPTEDSSDVKTEVESGSENSNSENWLDEAQTQQKADDEDDGGNKLNNVSGRDLFVGDNVSLALHTPPLSQGSSGIYSLAEVSMIANMGDSFTPTASDKEFDLQNNSLASDSVSIATTLMSAMYKTKESMGVENNSVSASSSSSSSTVSTTLMSLNKFSSDNMLAPSMSSAMRVTPLVSDFNKQEQRTSDESVHPLKADVSKNSSVVSSDRLSDNNTIYFNEFQNRASCYSRQSSQVFSLFSGFLDESCSLQSVTDIEQRLLTESRRGYQYWSVKELRQGYWIIGFLFGIVDLYIAYDSNPEAKNGSLIVTSVELRAKTIDDIVVQTVLKPFLRKYPEERLKDICQNLDDVFVLLELMKMDVKFVRYFMADSYLLRLTDSVRYGKTACTFYESNMKRRAMVKVQIRLDDLEEMNASNVHVQKICGDVSTSAIKSIFCSIDRKYNFLTTFVHRVRDYVNTGNTSSL